MGIGGAVRKRLGHPWLFYATLRKDLLTGNTQKEHTATSHTPSHHTSSLQRPVQVQDGPDAGFFGYSYNNDVKDDMAHHRQPIRVSYNHRSILVNDKPILLLGGSLHPVRHTRSTWNAALDDAVHMGLNLITIYVIWSAHQHFADSDFDWSLPGNDFLCDKIDESNDASSLKCPWTLGAAIQQAAQRRPIARGWTPCSCTCKT